MRMYRITDGKQVFFEATDEQARQMDENTDAFLREQSEPLARREAFERRVEQDNRFLEGRR